MKPIQSISAKKRLLANYDIWPFCNLNVSQDHSADPFECIYIDQSWFNLALIVVTAIFYGQCFAELVGVKGLKLKAVTRLFHKQVLVW